MRIVNFVFFMFLLASRSHEYILQHVFGVNIAYIQMSKFMQIYLQIEI